VGAVVTGPEHYKEAERLLELALSQRLQSLALSQRLQLGGASPGSTAITADAQVHATLALAAATALPDAPASWEAVSWDEVADHRRTVAS
jgi:hypothetical protein